MPVFKSVRCPVVVMGLALLAGCSDDSGDTVVVGPPPVDIAATGSYAGTLEGDDGDVALMKVVLARSGETSITLQTDDDERADIVLWGASDSDGTSISFEGTTASGADAMLDMQIDGTTLTGRMDSAGVQGAFSLPMTAFSGRSGALADVAGTYLRVTNLGGELSLDIAADGAVTLAGACDGGGSLREVDTAVNLYLLQLDAPCISAEALVTREDLVSESDHIVLQGEGLADAFYLP